MATEALLDRNLRPSAPDVLAGFDGVVCRCTEPGILVEAVLAAADIRQRRLYGRNA
jgi:aerobic-type carbon monoxide dehydrogenase small subunit (CoxS/CutS family)